jgi:hypothetical protein
MMESALSNDSPIAVDASSFTFDYISAFRASWLIDSDIDKSWFDEATKRHRVAPHVVDAEQTLGDPTHMDIDENRSVNAAFPSFRLGQLGATRTFTSWLNGGVVTQIAPGATAPQWFLLPGVELRRLSIFAGQFIVLLFARKYLHAPSVRLLKTQAIASEVLTLYEARGDHYASKSLLRERVEKLNVISYSNLGGAILRAALRPHDVANKALCLRLEIRLPLSHERKLELTQVDSDWARSLCDELYVETKGALL